MERVDALVTTSFNGVDLLAWYVDLTRRLESLKLPDPMLVAALRRALTESTKIGGLQRYLGEQAGTRRMIPLNEVESKEDLLEVVTVADVWWRGKQALDQQSTRPNKGRGKGQGKGQGKRPRDSQGKAGKGGGNGATGPSQGK